MIGLFTDTPPFCIVIMSINDQIQTINHDTAYTT